ncbi:Hypothetical protein CINCED_3A012730 [Cinara cedri]|uniref:Uncharacterized protein n=1 Tax=Cinara cedri TaxID=506608 RepID=A0A5E4M865_9HEMI|nr:Hypothetical protein CINCED_3A012730 [Cinara cedri]
MRLQSANKCFFGLSKIFRSRAISKNLKVRMYLTLLRPIVLYGAETWPLRKTEERRIAVFERKVLRKIYGAYFDVLANEWGKLHNEELQSLFQRPDILKEIKKKRRLVWAGHAWRKHDSLIRRVIEENPVGRRPLGRPRLRWEDCVRSDTETVEPECRWQGVAEDRDRWHFRLIVTNRQSRHVECHVTRVSATVSGRTFRRVCRCTAIGFALPSEMFTGAYSTLRNRKNERPRAVSNRRNPRRFISRARPASPYCAASLSAHPNSRYRTFQTIANNNFSTDLGTSVTWPRAVTKPRAPIAARPRPFPFRRAFSLRGPQRESDTIANVVLETCTRYEIQRETGRTVELAVFATMRYGGLLCAAFRKCRPAQFVGNEREKFKFVTVEKKKQINKKTIRLTRRPGRGGPPAVSVARFDRTPFLRGKNVRCDPTPGRPRGPRRGRISRSRRVGRVAQDRAERRARCATTATACGGVVRAGATTPFPRLSAKPPPRNLET